MNIDQASIEDIEKIFEKRKIPDNRWISFNGLQTDSGRILNKRDLHSLGKLRGKYKSGQKFVGELCIGKSGNKWMAFILYRRKPILIPINLMSKSPHNVFIGNLTDHNLKELKNFEQRLHNIGRSKTEVRDKLEELLEWVRNQSSYIR